MRRSRALSSVVMGVLLCGGLAVIVFVGRGVLTSGGTESPRSGERDQGQGGGHSEEARCRREMYEQHRRKEREDEENNHRCEPHQAERMKELLVNADASAKTTKDDAKETLSDLPEDSIYRLQALDIHGDEHDFHQYRGKVSLLVNVASE